MANSCSAPLPAVAVAGTGGVARALLAAFARGGVSVAGVLTRGGAQAEAVAREHGAAALPHDHPFAQPVICLLAVPDTAIADVARRLRLPQGSIVAHTAGSAGIDALAGAGHAAGVFYPLQTCPAAPTADLSDSPLLVEGDTEPTQATLLRLARRVSRRAGQADSRQRARLHLAAVFACNFANLMYAQAEQLMAEAGLDFALLHPLIEATARKATSASPTATQTGPAARGDLGTLARHMAAIDGERREIYRLLSGIILAHRP